MAWEGSDRRVRLPADWPAIRARRLALDGHRCTWTDNGIRCPNVATEVDHRTAKADDHRIKALRSLCHDHHAKKSAGEGVAARAARRARLRLPADDHPGLRRRSSLTCEDPGG